MGRFKEDEYWERRREAFEEETGDEWDPPEEVWYDPDIVKQLVDKHPVEYLTLELEARHTREKNILFRALEEASAAMGKAAREISELKELNPGRVNVPALTKINNDAWIRVDELEKQLLEALAYFYTIAPKVTADYADEKLDTSGRLLGLVRERVREQRVGEEV